MCHCCPPRHAATAYPSEPRQFEYSRMDAFAQSLRLGLMRTTATAPRARHVNAKWRRSSALCGAARPADQRRPNEGASYHDMKVTAHCPTMSPSLRDQRWRYTESLRAICGAGRAGWLRLTSGRIFNSGNVVFFRGRPVRNHCCRLGKTRSGELAWTCLWSVRSAGSMRSSRTTFPGIMR